MSILSDILQFITVLIASFKGISAGDKWVTAFTAAIKENTEQLRIFNESKSKDTSDKRSIS